ncbi:hypothetical protein WISP_72537 [Willisornis vidua]|uniref:Uncharacterized protein n=1 Tax=Willisornis vidua TaxID=1566151 RepID=A0ABQ9DCL8_9PASS|nr:hypothetical protein WISP_72537 [Willisornis vidua]
MNKLACLSCAQDEAKNSLASEQISDVEYTVSKLENEVLKSSLAFGSNLGEKLEFQVDKLVAENELLKAEVVQIKILLAAEKCKKKQLLEKQLPALIRQLPKSVSYLDIESWNRDIWSDNDDDEYVRISDSNFWMDSLCPLVKIETTVDSDGENPTTMPTTPWTPVELLKLQEKHSRWPGESEVEYM